MDISIPLSVFDFFASDPIGPMWNLRQGSAAAPPKVQRDLEECLRSVDTDEIKSVQNDPMFKHLGAGKDPDDAARVWLLERYLQDEIARRKLGVLHDAYHCKVPSPYDSPGLCDLEIDDHWLVPLSAFDFDGSRLLRNGHAFQLLTITSAQNSSHWLLRALYTTGLYSNTKVRLDPFLFGRTDEFPATHYRMLMYGRPLQWDRIARLRNAEHGQWRPGPLSRRSEATEYSWDPRSDGIHFVCEELCEVNAFDREPSRYLHAIYDPNTKMIQHFDGALRSFTSDEIHRRRSIHVRNAGKVGVRTKVFLQTVPVERENFSPVVQAFFVWNEDVRNYFMGELSVPGSHPAEYEF